MVYNPWKRQETRGFQTFSGAIVNGRYSSVFFVNFDELFFLWVVSPLRYCLFYYLWKNVFFRIFCEKRQCNCRRQQVFKTFNPSSANPEKWTNTLRQFVWVYVTILWGWRLRVKKKLTFHRKEFHLTLPVPIPDEERKLTYIIVFTLLCGPSKDFINP